MTHLDARLADRGEHGLVLVLTDGDGSDPSHTAAHRLLTGDEGGSWKTAVPRSSRKGWRQLADLVAWTAYQHLHRAPNRAFAWPRWDTYLAAHDVHAGPTAM